MKQVNSFKRELIYIITIIILISSIILNVFNVVKINNLLFFLLFKISFDLTIEYILLLTSKDDFERMYILKNLRDFNTFILIGIILLKCLQIEIMTDRDMFEILFYTSFIDYLVFSTTYVLIYLKKDSEINKRTYKLKLLLLLKNKVVKLIPKTLYNNIGMISTVLLIINFLSSNNVIVGGITFSAFMITRAIFVISLFYPYNISSFVKELSSLNKMFESPIIIHGPTNKITSSSKVFELNIKSLTSEAAEIYNIKPGNKFAFINEKLSNYNRDEILISVRVNYNKQNKIIRDYIQIDYIENKKKYRHYIYFELIFSEINNVYICTSSRVTYESKVTKRDYDKLNSNIGCKLDNHQSKKIIKTNMNDIDAIKVLSNYLHNVEINKEDDIFKTSYKDERNFIFREGLYGTGKTTSDLLLVSGKNKNPVLISFIRDNYNEDMLYVLFNTLREKTKTKFFKYSYLSKVVFYIIIMFFIRIGVFILDNTYKLPNLLFLRNNLYEQSILFVENDRKKVLSLNILFSKEVFLIVFMMIGIYTAKRIAGEFIIYKNNSSELFKEFYLVNIKKMIRDNNVILIFEDLDRLYNSDEIYKTFRILTNLNHTFSSDTNIIGIVSFEEDKLVEMLSGEKDKKSEFHKNLVKDYIDKTMIRNKIQNTKENLEIQEYIQEITEYYTDLIVELETDNDVDIISLCNDVLNIKDMSEMNYRTIRGMIDYYISNIQSQNKNNHD